MWITPNYQDTDFEQPLTIEDKITIFEDRVLGWKLDIADQVINGSSEREGIPHSGFAALDIVFSYFEMIAKYQEGCTHTKEAGKYFRKGAYSVFPGLKPQKADNREQGVKGNVTAITDEILDLMYKGVRCGLYHAGITQGRVVLTGDVEHPMAFDPQAQVLVVNPHQLVPALRTHLGGYVDALRDKTNGELCANFEARFDSDSGAG